MESSARQIGHEKQLFLDDAAVDTMDGLHRRFFQAVKHPENPVVRGEGPWELGSLHPVTALYDPELERFHLWYRATSAPVGQPSRNSVCYATSTDGVRWEKPDLGAVALSPEEGAPTTTSWTRGRCR